MKSGKLESPIKIDGTMQVVYDSGELSTHATNFNITGLNGDVDEEYEIIIRTINDYNGIQSYYMRINNDNTANIYGYQWIKGINTTPSAARDTYSFIELCHNPTVQNDVGLIRIKLHAKSGFARTGIIDSINGIAGTTVSSVRLCGFSYNDTSTNVTSLYIGATIGYFGVGSRCIVLKKVSATGLKTGNLNVQGKIYGVWQEIYKTTLAAAATSVTISNLAGNTDCLYRLRVRKISGYSGVSRCIIRPNNDTANNYGYQYIQGENSTLGANRVISGLSYMLAANTSAISQLGFVEIYLFVKSGYVRIGIAKRAAAISGTTIGSIELEGQVWNNTSDEITSLVIASDQANGLGIGTEIILERLNL